MPFTDYYTKADDFVARGKPKTLVADESSGGVALPDLELRLYERDDLAARREHAAYRRQYELERNKGNIRDRKRRNFGQVLGFHVAGIEVLLDPHAGIRAQTVGKLIRADVYGHHAPCAMLKKAVGEPSRGRAHIKARLSLGVQNQGLFHW